MSKASLGSVDQAAGLRNITRTKPVKVIAVSAGKGGVGKSSVSTNVAIALAEKNKKILLMDADLGLGNIDIMLGLYTKYNLSHVLQGDCHLSDILITGPKDIKIIPAASGTEFMAQLTTAEHAGIINAFNELTDDFDYLIIDTAAGITDTVLSFTRSAQEILVVVCDEPTSLTDAYALIKVLSKRYAWKHFQVVANMVRNSESGKDLFHRLYRVTEQFLDVHLDYLGAIPFDEKMHTAVKMQKAVSIIYPECLASRAFRQLANQIDLLSFSQLPGSNTSFFLERTVAEAH